MTVRPNFSSDDTALLRRVATAHLMFDSMVHAQELLALALWLDPQSSETRELMARVALRNNNDVEFIAAIDALKAKGRTLPDDLEAQYRKRRSISSASV